MARNLDQLSLGLDGDKSSKSKGNRAWLQAFYARAYAAGKEAGAREAEERFRLELELAAGSIPVPY